MLCHKIKNSLKHINAGIMKNTGERIYNNSYIINNISYAWLSEKKKDGYYYVVSSITPCKDYLQDALHNHIYDGKSNVSNEYHRYKPELFKMDERKTRILVCIPKEFYTPKKINLTKLFLNIIGVELGWGLTYVRKAAICEDSKVPKNSENFVIVAPNEWKKAAFILSFFTLMIRIGLKTDRFELMDMTSIDSMANSFVKWRNDNYCDSSYVLNREDKIFKIIRSSNKILETVKEKSLWPPNAGFSFHSIGGIVSASYGHSPSEELSKVLQDVLK